MALDSSASIKHEVDPHGTPAKTPGAKLDAGKAPVLSGLLDYFPRAAMAVASLSEYGANKYSWKGWEKVPDGYRRYGNAAVRHIVKESIEGPLDLDAFNDPTSPAQILHATQVAWNALARLELYLRQQEGPEAIRVETNFADWEPLLRMHRKT